MSESSFRRDENASTPDVNMEHSTGHADDGTSPTTEYPTSGVDVSLMASSDKQKSLLKLPAMSSMATPLDERAPLFEHECPEPCEEEKSVGSSGRQEVSSLRLRPKSYEHAAGPVVEKFPEDAQAIIGRIRSIESRLNVDETK